MVRRIFAMSEVSTLAVLGSLLAVGSAAAQNQGYSVWLHRNEERNGSSSQSYRAPRNLNESLYPAQSDGY